jgi:hypothetical protein
MPKAGAEVGMSVAAVRERRRGGDYTEGIAPIEEDPD